MNQVLTGSFLSKKRKEKNMTQTELAERLTVSNKTISKWEENMDFLDELLDCIIDIITMFVTHKSEDNSLKDVLDEFLLECVCSRIEDISELPKMLKDINYLDNKQELIAKTTSCEILDVEDYFVTNYSTSENKIHVEYEISFILQTFIDFESIWRIQGVAKTDFTILNADLIEYSAINEKGSNFSDNYERNKKLIHFKNIIYSDIECDTM